MNRHRTQRSPWWMIWLGAAMLGGMWGCGAVFVSAGMLASARGLGWIGQALFAVLLFPAYLATLLGQLLPDALSSRLGLGGITGPLVAGALIAWLGMVLYTIVQAIRNRWLRHLLAGPRDQTATRQDDGEGWV